MASPERPKTSKLRSYGIFIWGCGDIINMWGAGFAASDDIIRAIATQRILDKFSKTVSITVIVKGLPEQLEHVSKSTDGLRSDGKTPFAGYDVLKPIQEARDRKEWKLEPLIDRTIDNEQHEAKQLAIAASTTTPYLALRSKLLASQGQDYGIVADDSDHDIHGFLHHLEKST